MNDEYKDNTYYRYTFLSQYYVVLASTNSGKHEFMYLTKLSILCSTWYQSSLLFSYVFQDRELIHGMSVCHSLTIIDDKLTGDPLDLKMFLSTGWIFEEPKDDSSENVRNYSGLPL